VATITLKSDIFSVLSETGYPHFYGSGSSDSFPYIRYTLGSNYSDRLSNEKATKNIWYQVDVFSDYPFDVEANELLQTIESGLELQGLYTTDWIEAIDDENNTRYPVYHYFIEVRK